MHHTTTARFELPSNPALVNAMHAPKPDPKPARTVSPAMKALEDKINAKITANRQRVKNYLTEADAMKAAGYKMTAENRALAQARSRRNIAEQNASFGEKYKHKSYKAAAQLGDWLGLDKASAYLEHFLTGHGEDIVQSREDAMQSPFIRKAEAENLARTETMTLTGKTGNSLVNARMLGLTSGQSTHIKDKWESALNGTEQLSDGADSFLAFGRRSVKSTPSVHAIRKGDTIYVSGTVKHDASDRYDFNKDSPFDDMNDLQAKGLGVPFWTKSTWEHTFVGTVEVLGQDENGNNVLGNPKVTWKLKE